MDGISEFREKLSLHKNIDENRIIDLALNNEKVEEHKQRINAESLKIKNIGRYVVEALVSKQVRGIDLIIENYEYKRSLIRTSSIKVLLEKSSLVGWPLDFRERRSTTGLSDQNVTYYYDGLIIDRDASLYHFKDFKKNRLDTYFVEQIVPNNGNSHIQPASYESFIDSRTLAHDNLDKYLIDILIKNNLEI